MKELELKNLEKNKNHQIDPDLNNKNDKKVLENWVKQQEVLSQEELDNSEFIEDDTQKINEWVKQSNHNLFTKKKIKSRKSENSNKPTQPFVTFFNEKKSIIRFEKPELSAQELLKYAGEMWRSLSNQDKQQYKDKYNREMKEYQEKNKENLANILSKEAIDFFKQPSDESFYENNSINENPLKQLTKKRMKKEADKANDLFNRLLLNAQIRGESNIQIKKDIIDLDNEQTSQKILI